MISIPGLLDIRIPTNVFVQRKASTRTKTSIHPKLTLLATVTDWKVGHGESASVPASPS